MPIHGLALSEWLFFPFFQSQWWSPTKLFHVSLVVFINGGIPWKEITRRVDI
jgi:hypothetical protein